MRTAAALALALAVTAAAFAEDKKDDATKADLKALAGTWKYESLTDKGKEVDKEKLAEMVVTITAEGKWDVKTGDTVLLQGTVKLDASKKPKQADWTITSEGELKDKKAVAIYEVEKDTFKHCYTLENRPEKFESKEGTAVIYAVFKRVKK